MTTYYVVCPDYRSGPWRTLDTALDVLTDVESHGHCPHTHTIEIIGATPA